jgi:ATP-dependent 26S proteasome regulatory subunit
VAADAFDALFDAVRVSPDNLPLRRHLAAALLAANRADDAEREFRAALRMAPDDEGSALGLADAFFRQGRHHEGLAVLEGRPAGVPTRPAARLLAARLHLATGAVRDARACYLAAVAAEPDLADPELADRLGVRDEAIVAQVEADPVAGGVSFADVGGMEDVKEEIRIKMLAPLQHPDLFGAFGKSAGGGILLYGPPGCGKTHIARATAGEIGGPFLAVGLHEILDMWIGQSERNLHDVFERARRSAPSVLFFDEVDALGSSRAEMHASGGRHLINQFLSELDGIEGGNDGVLVLAATNAPWYVDSAFRRPGRFDQILFVPPPDAAARAAILRVLCAGKPVEAVDYDHLAASTDGLSGADLQAVVERAVEDKLRAALRTGGTAAPLTGRDLAAAARSVVPSTREWFAAARNWATHANAGGVYDPVLAWLDRHR